MNKEQVEKCVKVIESFPPLPFCLNKLLAILEDNSSSVNDIAKIIEMDQALTANVLRLINSSYYGYTSRISDISRAIVLLGSNAIKSLALGLAVMNIFYNTGRHDSGKIFYWEHSIGTALAGRMIMSHIHRQLAEETFTAGLLHDVGKMVFLIALDHEYVRLFEETYDKAYDLSDTEKKLIGIDHAYLGESLARKWNFPLPLQRAIRHHHHPELLKQYEPKTLIIEGCVLYMANWISTLQVLDRDISQCPSQKFHQIKTVFSITDETIDSIYSSLGTHIADMKRYFSVS